MFTLRTSPVGGDVESDKILEKYATIFSKYRGAMPTRNDVSLESFENSLTDGNMYSQIRKRKLNTIEKTDASSNSAALRERLEVFSDMVARRDGTLVTIEALREHFSSVAKTLKTRDREFTVSIRSTKGGFEGDFNSLTEIVSSIYTVASGFFSGNRSNLVSDAINCVNWSYNVTNSDMTLQKTFTEDSIERSVSLGEVEVMCQSCLFLLDLGFNEKYLAVYAGLEDLVRTDRSLTDVDVQKIHRVMSVIEYQLTNLVFDFIEKKLSIIHRYLHAYSGKLDLTPIFRIKDNGILPETKVRQMVTNSNIAQLSKTSLNDLKASVENLDGLDEIAIQLTEIDPSLSAALEDDSQSKYRTLRSHIMDLMKEAPESAWAVIGDEINQQKTSWYDAKALPVCGLEDDNLNVTSTFFDCGMKPSLAGFMAFDEFIGKGLDDLVVATEALVEGSEEGLKKFTEFFSGTTIPALPFGLSLESGECNPTLPSFESVDVELSDVTDKLHTLYSNGLKSNREKLSQIGDNLGSMTCDFGLEELTSVMKFVTLMVPLHEEAVEVLADIALT